VQDIEIGRAAFTINNTGTGIIDYSSIKLLLNDTSVDLCTPGSTGCNVTDGIVFDSSFILKK
jgi:hypothetical protein